jgi:8-oxo-dGTP pyrophosphatase MutT (NUDIX family)
MILQPVSDLHFELLYIVRSPFGIHGSQVAFPGGKIEKEEDALGCACRETLEEIGIELYPKQCIGQLSPVFIPPSHMIVYPQVFVLQETTGAFSI